LRDVGAICEIDDFFEQALILLVGGLEAGGADALEQLLAISFGHAGRMFGNGSRGPLHGRDPSGHIMRQVRAFSLSHPYQGVQGPVAGAFRLAARREFARRVKKPSSEARTHWQGCENAESRPWRMMWQDVRGPGRGAVRREP